MSGVRTLIVRVADRAYETSFGNDLPTGKLQIANLAFKTCQLASSCSDRLPEPFIDNA